MFLTISNILTPPEIAAIKDELATAAFSPGGATAGTHARAVKHNEQSSHEAVLKKAEAACQANPVFVAAAMPKTFIKLMVSRYQPGMAYGLHVDAPVMDGFRTDLSFTLFLNEPSSYVGGELVIEENDGTRTFKLPPGSLVLYPTTTLHRVEPVTQGERLAIVGWVRSLIRDHADRELLFDLENTIAALKHANTGRVIMDQIYKVRANLIRKWAED